MSDATIWSVTQEASFTILELSFTLIYEIFSIGITYDRKLSMEQYALNNVNNSLNTNIYSYLQKYGDQNYILYLNVVCIFNTSVNQTSVAA